MKDNEPETQEVTSFRAVLHPHSVIGPKGATVFMLAVSAISFVAGWMFLILGIGPVIAFLLVALVVLYAGLRMCQAIDPGYEEIELTPDRLTLVMVDGKGEAQRFEFNSHWVRVVAAERPGGGTRLVLASRGEETEFGLVLDDFERREFAGILSSKLLDARTGKPL